MSLRRFLARLRGATKRDEIRRELDEEIRAHLEFETNENREAGFTPSEARAAARRASTGGASRPSSARRTRRCAPTRRAGSG